jgi:hypothetical protein
MPSEGADISRHLSRFRISVAAAVARSGKMVVGKRKAAKKVWEGVLEQRIWKMDDESKT